MDAYRRAIVGGFEGLVHEHALGPGHLLFELECLEGRIRNQVANPLLRKGLS